MNSVPTDNQEICDLLQKGVDIRNILFFKQNNIILLGYGHIGDFYLLGNCMYQYKEKNPQIKITIIYSYKPIDCLIGYFPIIDEFIKVSDKELEMLLNFGHQFRYPQLGCPYHFHGKGFRPHNLVQYYTKALNCDENIFLNKITAPP